MPRRSTILFFFAKAAVLYGICLVPSLPLLDGYRAVFQRGIRVLFQTVGGDGRVYVEAIPDSGRGQDTRLTLENAKKPGPKATMEINGRVMGYQPTCFLLALGLATPVPWRRRGAGLMVGMVLVSAFVAFTVYLQLLSVFSADHALGIYSLPEWFRTFLGVLRKVLVVAPAAAYIVPASIWMGVFLRRGEWFFPAPAVSGERISRNGASKA